jgi:hypothetical protein
MAVHEGDTRGANHNSRPLASSNPTTTNRNAQENTPQQRDHAQALSDAMSTARKARSKSDAVIVGGIQQRAELYEKAFVQAKQVTIDALANDAAPAEQQARQGAALRTANVEVLPPEMVGKLAALDARHYGKLHDPQHRTKAALAMAGTARLSSAYRAALAAKAPEVSGAVLSAMGTAQKATEINAPHMPGAAPVLPRDQATSDPAHAPAMTLDSNVLERVAANRARDANTVARQRSLNGVEQSIEQKQARREERAEEQHTLPKATKVRQAQAVPARPRGDNQVASDEVFTASKDDAKPIIPAEVQDKYLRVGARFYHPKNTAVVAFEDKGNKLETRSNSEQIAETMVTIARARGWDEIKVSGSETFRKEVWLEAAAHGMKVKGYTPSEVDKTALAKRTGQIEASRVEPGISVRERESQADAAQASTTNPTKTTKTEKAEQAEKVEKAQKGGHWQPAIGDRERAQAFASMPVADAITDHPELAGTYAVMASMKKKAAADGLSAQQRAVVMARVEANLVNSIERGKLPEVKVREQVEVRHERAEAREVKR